MEELKPFSLEDKILNRIGEIRASRDEIIKAAHEEISHLNGVMVEMAKLINRPDVLPPELQPQKLKEVPPPPLPPEATNEEFVEAP